MVIFIFQYLYIYLFLMQNLQTINSVVNENTNQVNLILNYASKLLDLIHEKENEVVATNHANWGLQMYSNEYDYQLKVLQ